MNEGKIELAKVLRKKNHLNITEVAHQSGFTDSGYFSKVLKRIAGVSPKKFRNDL